MTNNDILKKLRVALRLKDDDIVKILALVDFKVTTTELGAIFRKEDHPNYKECGDQLLRNFLNGLIIHLRGPMDKPLEKVSDVQKKIIIRKVKDKGPFDMLRASKVKRIK